MKYINHNVSFYSAQQTPLCALSLSVIAEIVEYTEIY